MFTSGTSQYYPSNLYPTLPHSHDFVINEAWLWLGIKGVLQFFTDFEILPQIYLDETQKQYISYCAYSVPKEKEGKTHQLLEQFFDMSFQRIPQVQETLFVSLSPFFTNRDVKSLITFSEDMDEAIKVFTPIQTQNFLKPININIQITGRLKKSFSYGLGKKALWEFFRTTWQDPYSIHVATLNFDYLLKHISQVQNSPERTAPNIIFLDWVFKKDIYLNKVVLFKNSYFYFYNCAALLEKLDNRNWDPNKKLVLENDTFVSIHLIIAFIKIYYGRVCEYTEVYEFLKYKATTKINFEDIRHDIEPIDHLIGAYLGIQDPKEGQGISADIQYEKIKSFLILSGIKEAKNDQLLSKVLLAWRKKINISTIRICKAKKSGYYLERDGDLCQSNPFVFFEDNQDAFDLSIYQPK